MAIDFQYRQPALTYTLDQFIACQSDDDINYQNLSFIDRLYYSYSNLIFKFPIYNVLSDYISEIRDEYCVQVVLGDNEMIKYKYRPKLLAYDIYQNPELGYIILLINDMYSAKQFIKEELILPTKVNMKNICTQLYNANIEDIRKYNSKNTTITSKTFI